MNQRGGFGLVLGEKCLHLKYIHEASNTSWGFTTRKTVLLLHFCALNKVEFKILYSRFGVFLFPMMVKMRFAPKFNLAFVPVCASSVLKRRLC